MPFMPLTEDEQDIKKKKAQKAQKAHDDEALRLLQEQQKEMHWQQTPPIDVTKPHPADPLITYQPTANTQPVLHGVKQYGFPLDENGLSPYSGRPPVYYNGVLISSQTGSDWDGLVGINSGVVGEPVETSPGSWIVPNALIGGIPSNVARFMNNLGLPVPSDLNLSREEHTDRMNAIIDKMPKRTPEESTAHFYRIAYEQRMGIHTQEAAKRNALAGITTPDEAVQQPITQLMNMAHALTQARAPQPEPSLQEPSVPHLPNHKVAATAQQR